MIDVFERKTNKEIMDFIEEHKGQREWMGLVKQAQRELKFRKNLEE